MEEKGATAVHVLLSETYLETEIVREQSDKIDLDLSLSKFFSMVLKVDESDSMIQALAASCKKQKITIATLIEARDSKCLFDVLVRLEIPLGYCVRILKAVTVEQCTEAYMEKSRRLRQATNASLRQAT